MSNSYLTGNAVVITLSVFSGDAPADPESLSLNIEAPNSVLPSLTTYEATVAGPITKVSTGVYTYMLILNTPGVYKYRWYSSTGAVEGIINCTASILKQ